MAEQLLYNVAARSSLDCFSLLERWFWILKKRFEHARDNPSKWRLLQLLRACLGLQTTSHALLCMLVISNPHAWVLNTLASHFPSPVWVLVLFWGGKKCSLYSPSWWSVKSRLGLKTSTRVYPTPCLLLHPPLWCLVFYGPTLSNNYLRKLKKKKRVFRVSKIWLKDKLE